jgi:hypothetical protein
MRKWVNWVAWDDGVELLAADPVHGFAVEPSESCGAAD